MPDIQAEVREVWDRNAAFWDEHMGEQGNDFHRELVSPSAERLLALAPGETVLEVACGAGLFARRMAELGARVVATDFSEGMLERARPRLASCRPPVDVRALDASDPAQLHTLGAARFDAAVCNMALMDMADVEPLFAALPRLLKPGGRFVFTVCHPCFNNSSCARVAEMVDAGDAVVTTYSIKVSQYAGLGPAKGLGIAGQPVPQWYFHRTLSELLGTAFRHGLVLDGLEEPVFAPCDGTESHLSMRRFREMPPVLAGRLRPISRAGQ